MVMLVNKTVAFLLENEGATVTAHDQCYCAMLTDYFFEKSEDADMDKTGYMLYSERPIFGNRIISKNDNVT